jgi:chemotaxis receptor (MCP) glutamine deamidase CheD
MNELHNQLHTMRVGLFVMLDSILETKIIAKFVEYSKKLNIGQRNREFVTCRFLNQGMYRIYHQNNKKKKKRSIKKKKRLIQLQQKKMNVHKIITEQSSNSIKLI